MKDEKYTGHVCDREYMERIMEERCRLIDAQFSLVRQRFDAAEAALTQAKEVLNFRLHSLNQLREQVEHNTQVYLRKDVYDAKTLRYDGWIETVNRDLTVMKTRSIIYTGVVGFFIVLLDVILRYVVK